MKSHEKWIDASKGLLIFLVVAGHAFGAASHIGSNVAIMSVHENIYKVIYFFHMPAFFLLAGITWSDGGKGFWKYVTKKAKRLLLPYLAFMALSMLVEYMWAGDIEWHRLIILDGCRVNSPLWFLPCMFFVSVAYYLLDRCNYGWHRMFALVLLLLIIGFMIRLLGLTFTPKWMPRVASFLLFMLIGHKLLPIKVWENIPKFPGWACILLTTGFAVIGYFIPWEALCPTYCWFAYQLVALVGTLIVLIFCRAFPYNALCMLGVASLYILCLHKFPLVLAQMKVESLYGLLGRWSLCLTLLLSVLCTFICLFFVRAYKFIVELIGKEPR